MITSAGCNALDYLLDSPAEIHTIDMNPRQNALLDLKKALIEQGSFDELFAMFGKGHHASYDRVYRNVRSALPQYAQDFWDRHIDYFEQTRMKHSFYYHGTSGNIAWLFMNFVNYLKKNISTYFFNLLAACNLEEQKWLYSTIEHELWNAFHCRIVKHPLVMTMFGVPKAQVRLIVEQYPGGLVSYVRDKVQHVFTEILMKDNYFWRVYLTGSYTPACCPNYLKERHFASLRENVQVIKTYTSTLTRFLKDNTKPYSHFVLLDHQDWLADHNLAMLEEEWRYILQCSRTGTKILMRSASEYLDFLPEFVKTSLRFSSELTLRLHKQDRVGTYGSLHLAEVL